MRRSSIAVVAAAVVLVVAFSVARSRRGNRASSQETIPTAEVVAANFAITLPVEGALEAARSSPVVNMSRDTQIVSLLRDGTRVEAGDVVMALNDVDVKRDVDRLLREVEEAADRVRQEEDQAKRDLQNAKGSLEKAQEALRLAKLQGKAGIEKAQADGAFLEKEVEVAQGQADRRRRLLEQRLLPITDVEAAEDEVRDKQFSLEASKRALQRASEDAENATQLRQMDVQTATLDLQQAERRLAASVEIAQRQLADKQADLQEAQEQLDGMQVKAPASGLLLVGQIWEDGLRPLRVGDQVREGQRVANIIESEEMMVRCDLNEADVDLVKIGQEAEVRVPAIGAQPLAARVEGIDNIARQGSPWAGGVPGRKVFSVLVRMTAGDSRLRPGMGATVDIVLERVRSGLALPVEALVVKEGKQVVYAAGDRGYREVVVKVVKRNNAVAAVEGEVSAGDLVARRRPPDDLIVTATEGRGT
jgi:multidrug efflux pump subunit AcrA (membrane-fusion protein)